MTRVGRLSHSRMKLFRLCQRRYAYEKVHGYTPVDVPEPLVFGSALHRGLEAMWRSWLPGHVPAPLPDDLDVLGGWPLYVVGEREQQAFGEAIMALRADPHPDPSRQALIEELTWAYAAKWGGADLQPIAVEREFVMPLTHPITGETSATWDITGRLDVLAERASDGAVVVVEHKSTSGDVSVGSGYWVALRMDAQASTYFAAAQAMGFDPAAVVYDVVAKPRVEPLRATPPDQRKLTVDRRKPCKCRGFGCAICGGTGAVGEPPRLYSGQRDTDESLDDFRARVRALITSEEGQRLYFVRDDVARLEGELTDHRLDVWHQAEAMAAVHRDPDRAVRSPEACVSFGRVCSFFTVCSTRDRTPLSDRSLFRLRTDADANPEPEEEAACPQP